MLFTLLACTNGTVTSAETFEWYTDDVPCSGVATWTPPDPPPMLAMARIVHEPGGNYGMEYRTLTVGGKANGGEDFGTIACDDGDTVTVTYAVRADPE